MNDLFLTAIIRVCLSVLLVMNTSGVVYANPQGGQVMGGSATIAAVGKRLDVTQHSDRAVIDWRSFDIAVDEHTQFHQPGADAIALNRVNSLNPSHIAGQLSANGNIVLINPNGVFFDGSSRVDVNGIIAATANINPQDFMAGSNRFDITGNPDSVIINNGLITAKEAGLVGLVAPSVVNNGIIYAKLGRVHLASGDAMTVDFHNDDLLQVAVHDEAVKSQLISNNGILSADGGTVAMTAAAATDTINALIMAGGVIEANSVARGQNGAIIIGADGSNKTGKDGDSYVAVTGILDASGRDVGQQGGVIEVLGDHIAVADNALIDARGHSSVGHSSLNSQAAGVQDIWAQAVKWLDGGSATLRADRSVDNGVRSEEEFLAHANRAGGSIKIGGDYLGKGETQTAKTVNVEAGAVILNDALEVGDGGRTIIWSDDTTEYAGTTLSRGGVSGGHGGFLETSGKIRLRAEGVGNLSHRASGYRKGTYLLDPNTITIRGNFNPGSVSNNVLWLDAADQTRIELTYSADGLSGASASGTSGSTTITTSADISTALAVGSRIRLGASGSAATADTVGADTYIITAISGTTVTVSSALTQDYSAGTVIHRGLVSSWSDGSGSGNNATQTVAANRPLYVETNGRGSLRFNGTNTFLDLGTDQSLNIFTGSHSSVTAASWTQTTGNARAILNIGEFATNADVFGFNNTGLITTGYSTPHQDKFGYQYSQNSAGPVWDYSIGNNLNDGSPQGFTAVADDSGNAEYHVDGESATSVGRGGAGAARGNYIGRGYHGNFDGDVSGIVLYSDAISDDDRQLIEQYQSAQWGVTPTGPGTGNTEAERAMASDGYSTFTVDYLESLSTTANIVLVADTNVTLDMQGETLAADAGRSISITATNGNITDVSAGTIRTNNGNITLTAGGTGNIDLDSTNLEATNGGRVNLSAGGTISIDQASALTLGAVTAGGNVTLASDGAITFHSAVNLAHPLIASADENIILEAAITTSSSTANALQLSAGGNFINNAGANALTASNSTWALYSTNPVNNTRGGLLPNESLFGQTNIAAAIAAKTTATNNIFAYQTATRPVLTYTVNNGSVVYGSGYTNALPGVTYTSGLLAGDEINAIGQAGDASISLQNYTPGTDGVGTIVGAFTGSTGTMANFLGYTYSFIAGDLTITPKALSVAGLSAANKVYDGGRDASVSGDATLVSGGVIDGDTVTLAVGNRSGVFDNKNVGEGKTVTVSGYSLSGSDAGNYSLSGVTVTADITAKALSVAGLSAANKVYDGNRTASLSGTADFDGVIDGDTVTLTVGDGGALFDNKNVGTGKTVTVSGYSLSGSDAGNYSLSDADAAITVTADITAKALSVAGLSAANKVYDGGRDASVSGDATLVSGGVIDGDTVTLAVGDGGALFDNKNVGEGKTVTVSGYSLSGSDAGNYSLSGVTVTADITAKALSVAGLSAANKVYDGGRDASVSGDATLVSGGVIDGDTVTLAVGDGGALFDNKNVGTGKTVTVSGYSLSGSDAGNYSLSGVTVTADITAKALTVTSLSVANKVYDGNRTASLSGTADFDGVIDGDTVTLAVGDGGALFDNKNVGTGKTVTVSGYSLSGSDAGNYSLSDADAAITVTADITAKALSVAGLSAANKVYDGGRDASVSGDATLVSGGVIDGDTVTLAVGNRSGVFDNKNVGTGKTVTVSGYSLSGSDAGNYSLSGVTVTADITAKALTVTSLSVANKVYDGNRTASLSGTADFDGVIDGDTVTLAVGDGGALFDNKNVGTGKTVTVSGYSLSGSDAGNYSLSDADAAITVTADITAKALSVAGLSAANKVYDGGRDASVSGDATLVSGGVIDGDTVTLAVGDGGALFDNKNVGTGKTVTVSGYSLSGSDAGNYSLSGVTVTADITAKALSVAGLSAANKVYDGGRDASVSGDATLVSGGVIDGDTVTLAVGDGGALFDNKNVGTGKTVTVSGYSLSGSDAGNYSLSGVTVTADITAKALKYQP